MDIGEKESYREILYRLVDLYSQFEIALQDRIICDEIRNFLLEDLGNNYETFEELGKDIEHIQVPKRPFSSKKTLFSEKVITFLYLSMINFCRTDKVKGIPLSKMFIENLESIMKNTHCIHHSHGTEQIKGYAHSFCNEKFRENYFWIPVIVHNLFRFDFFSFKRPKGWRVEN